MHGEQRNAPRETRQLRSGRAAALGTPSATPRSRAARRPVSMANQGSVEFHIWTSRKGALDRPDMRVFDLDPPDDAMDALGATLIAPYSLRGRPGTPVSVPIDPTGEDPRPAGKAVGVPTPAIRLRRSTGAGSATLGLCADGMRPSDLRSRLDRRGDPRDTGDLGCPHDVHDVGDAVRHADLTESLRSA
ncbi:MAG TPA: hypothetical protein VF469_16175 [Kofleriaceae bacterium]